MKNFIIVIAFISSIKLVKAQNPEAGWFWSMKVEQNTLDDNTGKFSNMGWTMTSTGKYAFEFSPASVIFYSDGWMGKDYKETKTYTVVSRKKLEEKSNEKSTSYEYITTSISKELVRFEIQVPHDDEYNVGFIYMYDGVDMLNKRFTKLDIYGCVRNYKK